MKNFVLIIVVLLVIAGVVYYATRPEVRDDGSLSGNIVIKGSDTMADLGAYWAEEYMKINRRVIVSVSGGGSGVGIKALIEGTTDIAQTSRSMKADEIENARSNGIEPKEFIVGRDGLSVIVNPNNPIKGLSMEELSLIFQGKITNWKDLGWEDKPILIISREATSGTHIFFKEKVVQLTEKTAEFSPAALLLASSSAIVTEVAANNFAIGYVGMGFVKENVRALEVAKEKGAAFVNPSIQTVIDGDYPISRPLFLYTKGEPTGVVRNYLDFVLGEAGQKVLENLEFVPIK